MIFTALGIIYRTQNCWNISSDRPLQRVNLKIWFYFEKTHWNSPVRSCILAAFDEFIIKICVNVLPVVKEKKPKEMDQSARALITLDIL